MKPISPAGESTGIVEWTHRRPVSMCEKCESLVHMATQREIDFSEIQAVNAEHLALTCG